MQMPNQSAKFVTAVFAGVLAGANFIPSLNHSAHAEDSCLAAPNGQTPHGSHWRYRVEHGTKRHCWYLRDESDAPAQSAAVTSSPAPAPAKPAPAKADTAMQGSVANAHAELPWPQPNAAPGAPAPTGQVPEAVAANAPSSDNEQAATPTGDANGSQPTIASRWPNQLNADASDDSAPAADNSDASAPPDTASAPPPTAATVPLATADAPPSTSKPAGSMQMLLTIMIAALALAGVVGGAILRFGGRKRDEDEGGGDIDRRPIWDLEHSDRPAPYPAVTTAPRPPLGLPRELRTVEPDDAIKEMLARLARSAQT
jgi:hypothetical protein